MTGFAATALSYAERGISVFPLLPRSKEPRTRRGFKDASADPAKVRTWWQRDPNGNIGIATGEPAGFWVLDIDGPEAEAALQALETAHGALPATVQQKTGRGRHLCFRWNPDGPEMRNRSKVAGAPIDVRGNGGYIVAPPSIHPGDPKKGVPPGRVYVWDPGLSPDEHPFAEAPAWLVDLCKPTEAAPAAARVAEPRELANGRATRYGEVVLDACVAQILQARKGSRDTTLYRFSCKAAGLVPTGHIQADYLRRELERAGGVHVPDAMSEKQLVRQVERAMAWGEAHPWGPDPDARSRPATRAAPAAQTPVEAAIARNAAVGRLDASGRAGGVVDRWLAYHMLSAHGVPGAADRLRLDARIPGGVLLPLQRGPDAAVDGAAVFSMAAAGEVRALDGLHDRRIGILAWPEGADQVLVATNLLDAWSLGQAAFESGDPMIVVVAPRLSTFAGVPMGDRFGRVDPAMPAVDPKRPPWTWPGMSTVYLAVRRDLRSPDLRGRKALGGTRAIQMEGSAAARFWGGLAAAAWKGAGANAVRLLDPPPGAMGFSDQSGVA